MKVRAKRVLKGHKGNLRGVCISPDGAHVASVDEKGLLRIGALMSGEPTHLIQAHSSYAMACAWGEAGLWTVGVRAPLIQWDPVTGKALRQINAPDVSGVFDALHMHGSWAATRCQHGSPVLWDLLHDEVTHFPKDVYGGGVVLCDASPSLVLQQKKGVLQRCEGTSLNVLAETTCAGWIHSVVYNADSTRIAVSIMGNGHHIVVLDGETLEVVQRLDDVSTSSTMGLCFSRCGTLLVAQSLSNPVKVIALETGEVMEPSLKDGCLPVGQCVALSRDDACLVIGAQKKLYAFDMAQIF